MNILLAGGASSLVDHIINKLHKEGHRIYVLTGSVYQRQAYNRKVFEKYNFTYDCDCLWDIYESINPEVVLFMGAFDENFSWENSRKESVRYYAGISNLLMAFAQLGKGRFINLSSEEVFNGSALEVIEEDEPTSANGFRAIALAQGEEMCESYRRNQNLDIISLRLDHLCGVPSHKGEVKGLCEKMCMDAVLNGRITVRTQNEFSILYQSDAVEAIYKAIACRKHERSVYQISSYRILSELDLAQLIQSRMGSDKLIIDDISIGEGFCKVLSCEAFNREFKFKTIHNTEYVIDKILDGIKRNKKSFEKKNGKKSFWERFSDKTKQIFKSLIPYIENMICFIPFFMLNNRAVGSAYFANLDFYLLYVLLFAIVYGQFQATFSATLAVAGYCFRQMYTRSGFDVMLDYNTYVWIAQLFILGLVVGYMRDRLRIVSGEREQEIDFLEERLEDIQDINSSNVRMKKVMETQIINQNDSVGTIYEITSKLDQYVPEEVLFYAAEMLTKLVDSKDIAIYTVTKDEYARLISFTSPKARSLGNSLKYSELDEVYQDILQKKVYINRSMDERYPMMANAIYSEDRIQLIVMIWSLPFERMTLGQANRLVVICYLIQNAVIRANRHLKALQDKRYVEGTNILEPEAFQSLVQAFLNAKERGLAECSMLKIEVPKGGYEEIGSSLRKNMRQSDYLGELKDGNLYVLLANTDKAAAHVVVNKFAEAGYQSHIQEDVQL